MIHVFIVNPMVVTGEFATSLRAQIPKDIESYIFTVNSRKGEADIVRQISRIFDNEKIRIYCCGGSGTFRNAMEGVDDFSEIEMAFIPFGMTNDFIKVFGADAKKFSDIQAMIDGNVVDVDYIRTNHGLALNSFSNGLDTKLIRTVEKYRLASSFAKPLPYIIALFSSVFLSKPVEYSFSAEGSEYVGKFSEVYIGNGGVAGGFVTFVHNPKVCDGLGHFILTPNKRGLRILNLISHFNKNDMDCEKNNVKTGFARKFKVKRTDGEPFEMNFDGELEGNYPEWEIEIVEKGLKFVVPKGVSIDGI